MGYRIVESKDVTYAQYRVDRQPFADALWQAEEWFATVEEAETWILADVAKPPSADPVVIAEYDATGTKIRSEA